MPDLLGVLVSVVDVSRLMRLVLLAGSAALYVVSGFLSAVFGVLVASPDAAAGGVIAVLLLSVLIFLSFTWIVGWVLRCRRSSLSPLLLVPTGFSCVGASASQGLGPLLLLSLGLLAILGLIAAVWTNALIKRGP